MKLRILIVIGTRPEAVKLAPVITQLQMLPKVVLRVLVTAQHRDMLDQVLQVFHIHPAYDLDVMRHAQVPAAVLSAVISGLQPVLHEFRPDWVLVQGDTTTALGAALAAAYAGCRVGHVEAGLRTYDFKNPFPEEINRVAVDHISDLCFAPTAFARQALLREGIADAHIHVTGNTVIDALQFIAQQPYYGSLPNIPENKKLILVTAHRRENHGAPLMEILHGLQRLAMRSDICIVYPVHRNPNVREPVQRTLAEVSNIMLVEPYDYLAFIHLMKRAYLILTDSGGIQEEAPGMGIPVLIMRTVTERPEAIDAGVARLVGATSDGIFMEASRLLDDPTAYRAMAHAANPFGDGKAAARIAQILLEQ